MSDTPNLPPPSVDIVQALRGHIAELAKTWKDDAAELVDMERAAQTIESLRAELDKARSEILAWQAAARRSDERLAHGKKQYDELRAELAALQPDGEGR